MKNWNGTTGEWTALESNLHGEIGYEIQFSKDGELVTDYVYNKSDAELIADAGNTIQKCDLLPSELLERYNETVEALKTVVECTDKGEFAESVIISIELIKKHESC